MRLAVLGPLEVKHEDGRLLDLGSGRQVALLAMLVLHAGEVVSADRLIDDFWGGSPPASAPKLLQGYVSQLRRVLPPHTIATRGSGYLLAAETDVREFERLIREASRQEPPRRARTLRTALDLWRGGPYADVEYEPWAQAEIGRLHELRLAALEARIDADLELGESTMLVPELEALATEHPLRERFHAQLMLALYRSSRQADALEVFADTRRTLIEQLGVEPGPELRDLQRRILDHDPDLGPARRPLPVAARPVAAATRRAPWLVICGAMLLAAGAAVAGWQLTHAAAGVSSATVGSAILALDAHSGK